MSTRTALVVLLLGLTRPAAAGPANTPLPTFADGAPAQAVYTALGVITPSASLALAALRDAYKSAKSHLRAVSSVGRASAF